MKRLEKVVRFQPSLRMIRRHEHQKATAVQEQGHEEIQIELLLLLFHHRPTWPSASEACHRLTFETRPHPISLSLSLSLLPERFVSDVLNVSLCVCGCG